VLSLLVDIEHVAVRVPPKALNNCCRNRLTKPAAVFAALYVGHTLGDHWVQTSCQAASKGGPGWAGRLACGRHVATLTLTKVVVLVLVPVVLALRLDVAALGLVLGLGVDAVSHYWADRRSTLKRLATVCGKREFYVLGTPDHPAHPVTAAGAPAATLGTGAYALDLLCTSSSGCVTGECSGSEVRSDPERFAEPGHVVAIPVGGLVALVEVDLLLGGQAGNGAALNRAGGEALRRIDERVSWFQRSLGGTSVGCEGQRVQVDLASRRVPDDETRGAPVERFGEADFAKSRDDSRLLFQAMHEVQIPVVAGLPSQQGIEAPAPTDPDVRASLSERVQDLQHIIASHGRHSYRSLERESIRSRLRPVHRLFGGAR
jgi:hypothetical protein